MGELWGVFWEYFWENWLHCNGTELYVSLAFNELHSVHDFNLSAYPAVPYLSVHALRTLQNVFICYNTLFRSMCLTGGCKLKPDCIIGESY